MEKDQHAALAVTGPFRHDHRHRVITRDRLRLDRGLGHVRPVRVGLPEAADVKSCPDDCPQRYQDCRGDEEPSPSGGSALPCCGPSPVSPGGHGQKLAAPPRQISSGPTRSENCHSNYNAVSRARSSAGERSLHTREVAGSKPAVPITEARQSDRGDSTVLISALELPSSPRN